MSDAVNEVKLCWSASGKKHVIFTSGFLKLCCRFHIFAPFRVCFNCTKPPQHKAAGLSNLQKCDICTMQTQLLLLVLLTGINLYFRVEITIACLLRRHIAAVLSTKSDPLFELAWPGFLLLCYLVCSRWAYTLQVRPKHAAAACRPQFTQTLKNTEIRRSAGWFVSTFRWRPQHPVALVPFTTERVSLQLWSFVFPPIDTIIQIRSGNMLLHRTV